MLSINQSVALLLVLVFDFLFSLSSFSTLLTLFLVFTGFFSTKTAVAKPWLWWTFFLLMKLSSFLEYTSVTRKRAPSYCWKWGWGTRWLGVKPTQHPSHFSFLPVPNLVILTVITSSSNPSTKMAKTREGPLISPHSLGCHRHDVPCRSGLGRQWQY